MTQGKAIIFTAPSGAGKTTIVKYLLSQFPELVFSISATTRSPRDMEVPHKDYYFLSQEEFQKKIDDDAFIEWEEFYGGSRYGTLKEEVERIWDEGKHVIFDVEVKGATNIKQYFGEQALAVFVKVPSMEELEKRLSGRGTESAETFAKRMDRASFEMSFEDKFDVTLVNKELEQSFAEARKLVGDFLNS
jgi:guanylate kinase